MRSSRHAAVLLSLLVACGPGPVNPDGGLVADAGAMSDAGVGPDSGVVMDAGVVDAGSTDAGAVDAGRTADAGLLDAGLIDAGVGDASVPTDGGGVDGGPTRGVLLGGEGPLPGPLVGVRYSTPSGSGITDSMGGFDYRVGEQVTFVVGDVAFRPVTGAALLSPFKLVAPGTCLSSSELEKALVLLLSLDVDGVPATGTTLPAYSVAPTTRALSSLSLADVATVIGQLIPGRAALSPNEAVDRFMRQIDDEAWMEQGLDSFAGAGALTRGQGLAANGTGWIFSGTLSLERTDATFARQQVNNLAIPTLLALAGSDHIGDIDVWNGTIYAPIEDGRTNYMSPKLVLFDAQSLTAGMQYSIPRALQTEGVPWVAVNGAAGHLYFAEWNPTTQLNIFSLSTVQLLSSLTLRPPAGVMVGRVQGAKVFEGALYLATDDATKSLFKMNLQTGTVQKLFSINTTGEQEGLAFSTRADGTQLHTLNVNASTTGSELRHHRRTRLPLRLQLCP
ncbi:MAG: hypothetical protein Q8L14_06625 [Myxococcales bacterium]|nr:hypothetical protein [Myxococcales bacterium]